VPNVHSRPMALVALMFASSLFAACLSEGPEAPPAPTTPSVWALPPGFVDPLILDHDHSNAKLHDLSYNVAELFHHPLGGSNLKSSGAHAVDLQNGFLFVAAYGASADVSGGLYIFDLKDPKRPNLVGQFNLPGSLGGDRSMEATDDGNWVVLGTEPSDCAGHTNPFAPGIYLIDARDKAKPVIADYKAGSTHSLTIHRVKGEDYVYAAFGATGGVGAGNILKINKGGLRPTLETLGSVQIRHDSAAYDDPVLGKPILYVANVGDLVAYDVSEPAKPAKLGFWALSKEEAQNHYVHAVSMEMVQERRILALESEDWRANPSPVWILDATDFDAIERIGNWTNPGQKPANAGQAGAGTFNGQLTFSTHNPRLEDGIVYLNHYHGGMWMLNVSSIRQAMAPEILGYYLPHNDNGGFVPRSAEGTYPKPNSCGFELDEVPIVFDLEVKDGIVYAADLHTGLYVLEYRPQA
jgi:hypothetical protein